MSFNTVQGYAQVKQFSCVEDASPHKLVDMLFSASIDRISEAAGQIDRGDIKGKGVSIGKAISIIEELRRTLDLEKGGELAQSLHDLYVYIKEQLLHANLQNDKEALNEAVDLITTVRAGWQSIPEELHDKEEAAA